MEDKIRLQSRVTDKYYEQIFEEMKELEKKKSDMKETKQEGSKDREVREGQGRGGLT